MFMYVLQRHYENSICGRFSTILQYYSDYLLLNDLLENNVQPTILSRVLCIDIGRVFVTLVYSKMFVLKKIIDNPFNNKLKIIVTADRVQTFFNHSRRKKYENNFSLERFHSLASGKTRADYFKPDVVVVCVTRYVHGSWPLSSMSATTDRPKTVTAYRHNNIS